MTLLKYHRNVLEKKLNIIVTNKHTENELEHVNRRDYLYNFIRTRYEYVSAKGQQEFRNNLAELLLTFALMYYLICII